MTTTNEPLTDALTYFGTPNPALWTELGVGPLYAVKYHAKTRTFDVIDRDGDIVRGFKGRGMAVNYAARLAREDQD
jgi:hypothetical protein